jgi:hypothetical protein
MTEEELLDPEDFEEETSSEEEDEAEENSGADADAEKEQKAESEKEKNARFAQMRREREAKLKEREQRLKQEAHEQELIAKAKEEAELGILKTNPFTNKPIKDGEDLKIYKIQQAISDKGGDPIEDLADELAELNRKENSAKKEAEDKKSKEEKALQDKIYQEVEDLRKKYPKLDTKALADDKYFNEVSDEKGGRWTVIEIYEEAERRKANDNSDDNQKLAEKIANKHGKQLSSTGGSSKESHKKLDEMTYDEYKEYMKNKYGG